MAKTRNPTVTDEQLNVAVAALADIAAGRAAGSDVGDRVSAASMLLAHAWDYELPDPSPSIEEA